MPTETGLRFFVDSMLEFGDLSADERARIEAQVKGAARTRRWRGCWRRPPPCCRVCSRGAGVVTTTKNNARLKHAEFVALDATRALVILVSEDGAVENRVVALPPGLPPSALTEATNYLNARIRGRTLDEVRGQIEARRARLSRNSTRSPPRCSTRARQWSDGAGR